MRSVASHPKVKITAICDVDARHMKLAAKDFGDAIQVKDWRELLTKNADRFDAITVGIPDHMHASVGMTALRAKKHLYLQKPMAPTIHECRALTLEAAKSGLVTQLGNQGRSGIEARMTVELIRSGAIGKIKEVVFWENKPLNWWPKNEQLRPTADAIPEGFDWALWLGVQGDRPYLADTYHPQTWRAWRDFGCGELGDMGCHHFDATFDALKLTAPKRVRQVRSGPLGEGMWAKSRVVEFEFAGNELIAGDTLKLTWYDGEMTPPVGLVKMPAALKKFPGSGHYWVGEGGSIFKQYGLRPYVLPEESFPAEKYPRDFAKRDHYHDWVDAILEGRKSCDDFSHGGPLTETVIVGTFADRFANQWLEWDRDAMKITNIAAANERVKREYRDGWKIDGLG